MAQEQLIYGIHAVAAALRRSAARLTGVAIAEGSRDNPRLQTLVENAVRHGVTVRYESRKILNNKVSEGAHQGVVAWRQPATPQHKHKHNKKKQNQDKPTKHQKLDGVQ